MQTRSHTLRQTRKTMKAHHASPKAIAAALLLSLWMAPIPAAPQSFSTVAAFKGPDGRGPQTSMVLGTDGNFYGTTSEGGAYNYGTAFVITPAGALTTLHTFEGYQRALPNGLVQGSDGNFYGTAAGVGYANPGMIFVITPAGSFAPVYYFNGPDGAKPAAGLVQGADGNFYGTTKYGGANDDGTVFKVTPAGALTTLHAFTGADGFAPVASLLQASDGNFYGTTSGGGANGKGTLFVITPTGAFTSLHSFTGTGTDGADPEAGLIQAPNTYLYGTTQGGGASGQGTTFLATTAGSVATLHSFTGGEGAIPASNLLLAPDGNFYGTTYVGGTYGDGVVFQMQPAGNVTTLHSFTGGDGAASFAGLAQGTDGNFYGTTRQGGANSNGVVFVVTPGGTLTDLYSFGSSDGANPYAELTMGADGNLYGTTVYGGRGVGTVFMATPAGALNTIHAFNGADGYYPYGGLTIDGSGNFYGTTAYGGVYGDGNVFYITPAGAISSAHSFNALDGNIPLSTPIQTPSTEMFGATAEGGTHGYGNLYVMTPEGYFNSYYSFSIGDGNDPVAPPVLGSDGLYGTCEFGGAYGYGTIYKVPPEVSTLTWVVSFNYNNGAYPVSSLVRGQDGNYYGVTPDGGSGAAGTVFRITPAGALTTLYAFTGGADGANPYGRLLRGTDGNFYGTTYTGGVNGTGTVFSVSPAGTLTTLYSFSATDVFGRNADGAYPIAGLIQAADGSLYGTAYEGGAYGFGTIFRVGFGAFVAGLSPSSTPACGPDFTLTVNGAGFAAGAVVNWNVAPLDTTFVSATQLSATVPAADIASPGAAAVTVTQNGVASNAATFTITNPQPVLSSLSPPSTSAGGPAFTLTANGSCFVNNSTVYWNGAPLATTFVSAGALTATVPAALTAVPGTAQVTVVTPGPGGGTSAAVTFTIISTNVAVQNLQVSQDASGNYRATVALTNTGYSSASNLQITFAALSVARATNLPLTVGNIAGGSTRGATLAFPAWAGASGDTVPLVVSGTFRGGQFFAFLQVTLP